MATLRSQFDRALTNIQINGDKADRAVAVQSEVRDVLEADVQLRAWGVDTKLIGSYGRNTGIYPGKDVDVFVKLTALDTNAPPQAVYDAVWDALAREYGTRAEAQDRSIKVDFSDSGSPGGPSPFFADAVPAVHAGQHWAIPARDRDLWSSNADRWVVTDPERFGELSAALSTSTSSPSVGGRDAYKPIVKLMRQARRTHMGDRRPGGLFVEFATYEAWVLGQVAGHEWDPLFAQTLRQVAQRFATAHVLPLLDPALGTPVAPAVASEDLAHAAAVFSRLASLADSALAADDCQAAVKWREILGGNERAEHVFPLPAGCDANGNRIRQATVGRSGSEARRFG